VFKRRSSSLWGLSWGCGMRFIFEKKIHQRERKCTNEERGIAFSEPLFEAFGADFDQGREPIS
jgi:hypothetical protein